LYYLPYKTNLKEFSRKLRKNSALGEILLWQKLRARGMMNYSFNRQKPLGKYIVDFYCKRLNLVIEIDSAYHCEPEQRLADEKRKQRLEDMGLSFLRFSEQQARKDMDWVLKEIEHFIADFEKRQSPFLIIQTHFVVHRKSESFQFPFCKKGDETCRTLRKY
jgi:very-short-patch-repair endonuclease